VCDGEREKVRRRRRRGRWGEDARGNKSGAAQPTDVSHWLPDATNISIFPYTKLICPRVNTKILFPGACGVTAENHTPTPFPFFTYTNIYSLRFKI
jgi:hypothetical protein